MDMKMGLNGHRIWERTLKLLPTYLWARTQAFFTNADMGTDITVTYSLGDIAIPNMTLLLDIKFVVQACPAR